MSGDVFAEGRVHARLITFAAAPALAFEPLDHIRVDPQCQAPLARPKEPAALSAGPVRDLRDFAGVDRLLRHRGDRKRGVEGKSVSVRVDPGGRRIITKKNTSNTIKSQNNIQKTNNI